MVDVAHAAAAALTAGGRFAAVTGRAWDGAGPIVDAAAAHVVSPGPTTRLAVAAGVGLGGHRGIAVLDDVPAGPPPDPATLAFTTSAGAATSALAHGWTVVQPWSGDDVEPLIDAATQPALVLLTAGSDIPVGDPPSPRRTRLWLDGDMATLVASGSAVPTMIALAQRLQQRGVDIAAVEVAILTTPAQNAMVGGASVLVAGIDTATAFRGENWPRVPTTAVPVGGRDEADLIGAVLAAIPAGH